MNQDSFEREFIKPINFWGRLTNYLAFIIAFIPGIYLYLVHGALPPIRSVITGALSTISFVGVLWFIEPVSYFPILGTAGTYMSFLSGNISNMRVPCSVVAQSAADVEEGTQKGSIISVLGIGSSVIVNLIVMLIGAFFGGQLLKVLPAGITAAFDYILPAVFGAIFGQFAPSNFKIASFALILGVAVILFGLPEYIALPICVFLTIYLGIKTRK